MKPQPITAAYDLTTGRGRLRYLADEVLARVTREALPFDLWMWVADEDNPYDCGTAACACGWAVRDPLLQDQGLGIIDGIPSIDGSSSHAAVFGFFGLNFGEGSRLFYRENYPLLVHPPTAADVAARIRAHLAETEGV